MIELDQGLLYSNGLIEHVRDFLDRDMLIHVLIS